MRVYAVEAVVTASSVDFWISSRQIRNALPRVLEGDGVARVDLSCQLETLGQKSYVDNGEDATIIGVVLFG